MYAQCFLVCKICFSDLKKIQSFARLNEWKEKEKSKWRNNAPDNKAKFCSLVINFYYQLYKVQTTFKAGQSVTKFTRNGLELLL